MPRHSAGGGVCSAECCRGSSQLTGAFKGRGGETAVIEDKEQEETELSAALMMRPWWGEAVSPGEHQDMFKGKGKVPLKKKGGHERFGP